jgi:ASC-1-like (ASCH) protein
MTIENADKLLSVITSTITEDDDYFTIEDENLQVFKETLQVAITTMRKYQTMQEVLEKVWNVPSCMLDEAECLNKIMETYRTVRW